MSDESAKTASEALDIVRDGTFTRAVVDKVAVLNLGRDLELACIQVGPMLQSIEDVGDEEKIDLTNSLTEVVRIRMSWLTAVAMVMHILERGVTSKRLKREALETSFAELWSRSPTSDSPKASADEQ